MTSHQEAKSALNVDLVSSMRVVCVATLSMLSSNPCYCCSGVNPIIEFRETELGWQSPSKQTEVVNEESFQDQAECPSSASTTTRIAGAMESCRFVFREEGILGGSCGYMRREWFPLEVASIKPRPGLKTSFS